MAETATADIAAILRDYVPRSEYEAALDAIQAATEERDTHRTAAEQHTGRLKELEGKVRSRAYRDAYDKLAKGKVKEEYAGDVYDLLKIEPDADEPDEKAMGKALEKFLEAKKHYAHEEKPARKEIPAGEGATRGRSIAPGEPEMRVSRSQLANAMFMRDNQAKVHAAQKAGLLVIDDD